MTRGRVLVTGCAGFIGSHVAEYLLNKGYEVLGIDCFTPYYSKEVKRYNMKSLLKNDDFKFIELDLSIISINDLVQIVKKVDMIVHEAAQPGVRSSWGEDFETYVRHNISATQKLLEAAVRAGNVKRFVYASSSSVYGNVKEVPIKEEVYPRPYSPYGVTKLAAENLCRTYFENYRLPVVMLRYFTVYGPRQRPDMAFHIFIKAMLKNKPIEIYGDGSQIRDFTYVEDVVEATILAMETKNEELLGEAINIGSARPIKLIDAIKTITDILGVEPRLVFLKPKGGDVRITYADISKAERLLSWRPRTDFRYGLEKQIEWMKIMSVGLIT